MHTQVVSMSNKAETSMRSRATRLNKPIITEVDGKNCRMLAAIGAVHLCTSKVNLIRADHAIEILKSVGVDKTVKETLRHYRAKAKQAQITGCRQPSTDDEQEEQAEG